MKSLEIGAAAQADLESAAAYYQRASKGLGERFLIDARELIVDIMEHPFAGAPLFNNFRRRLILEFPYSIVYRVEEERVYVIAVMHQHRHPDCWRARID